MSKGLRLEILSIQFACFLAVLLAIYYAAGRFAPRRQWTVLLVGSLVFYVVAAGWGVLPYLLGCAGVTWAGALGISSIDEKARAERKAAKSRSDKKAIKARSTKRRRIVMWTTLVVCLLVLGYLKYWNVALFQFGLAEGPQSLGILLPLGISFYTFSSLGYVLDVYNDRCACERNFLRHLLFVSWFPQLIQGPINRYDQTHDELLTPHKPDAHRTKRALLRLGYGLLKKFAIANVLAGSWTALLDTATEATHGPAIALGILYYSLYMYGDFSGGIDMVEGVSELFGIEMAQNFRQPYLSVSLADFWRRWHMSLGDWMKNHVFYPLAVSRPLRALNKRATCKLGKQVGRTISACVANVVVFLVVGLWHGAEWHFLAWGLYNGVIIALADLLAPVFDRITTRLHVDRAPRAWRAFTIVRTFAVVCIGRYFDAIVSVPRALMLLRNTFFDFTFADFLAQLNMAGVPNIRELGFGFPAILACIFVFLVSIRYERGMDVREHVLAMPFYKRALIISAGVIIFATSARYISEGGMLFVYAFF